MVAADRVTGGAGASPEPTSVARPYPKRPPLDRDGPLKDASAPTARRTDAGGAVAIDGRESKAERNLVGMGRECSRDDLRVALCASGTTMDSQKGEEAMKRRGFLRAGAAGVFTAVASHRTPRAAWGRESVVFEPETVDDAIANPGVGFETFHCFNRDDRMVRAENYPQCSIAYFRFYWDKLEPRQGTYNFDLIDSLLQIGKACGQGLALRFMPTASANLNTGTPKWFVETGKGFPYTKRGRKGWAPDHNDPYFLAKQEELVTALGERYNGHPGIIRMEIGSVGFWGEWHLSHAEPAVPMISEENAVKVIDLYLKHWNKTPLAMLIGYVPGLKYAVSKGTGWRADSLGDYGHWSDNWYHMRDSYPRKLAEARAADAWKRGPVAFEPPGSMRDLERYVPSKGGGYDNMWSQALAWHGSAYNAKSGSIPDAQVPAMNRFLKKCGYRLTLRRLAVPQPPTAGERHLQIAMEFENVGVAPPYRNYALAVRLTGGAGSIVLTSAARLPQWLPGRHKVEERLVLPDTLSAGEYALSLAILDPSDRQPAVRLANKGRDRHGWYPAGKVRVRATGRG